MKKNELILDVSLLSITLGSSIKYVRSEGGRGGPAKSAQARIER